MVGTMMDCIIADGIAKNINFNHTLGFEAILKDAYVGGGRPHIADYLKYGYVPAGVDRANAVARNLNNYLADHCKNIHFYSLCNETLDVMDFRL